MKKKIPAWLVLTVICVVAAVLLAATNMVTKDVIAENARREKMETLGKLLPDAKTFEDLESGISVGKNDAGEIIGYAAAVVTQGFGGEVETTVAALADGTINGISVGGANFSETAGLGARAKEPEFQIQFAGLTAPVALSKDGGEVDALSGATITSRAVIKGVNEAMEIIAAEAGFEVASSSTAEHLGENRYAATAQGFGGPVKVYLTLDADGAIQEIVIGNSEFNETPGLGARAQEEEFRKQFIGKKLPLTIGDIDALSGATITTNAVLDAIAEVNGALENGLADSPITEEILPAAEEAAVEEAVEESEETAEAAEGEKHTASAQGFMGKVAVTLTVDENGNITSIKIGDENFKESPEFGAKALEEDFQKQFIGKPVTLTADDVDALTGATYTSNAIFKAISQIAEEINAK